MYCDLGLETRFITYEGDIEKLRLFEGHGVAIVQIHDKEPSYEEVGCIDFETSTLVGKSGGQFIESGCTIVHNPEICSSGIRRYNT